MKKLVIGSIFALLCIFSLALVALFGLSYLAGDDHDDTRFAGHMFSNFELVSTCVLRSEAGSVEVFYTRRKTDGHITDPVKIVNLDNPSNYKFWFAETISAKELAERTCQTATISPDRIFISDNRGQEAILTNHVLKKAS